MHLAPFYVSNTWFCLCGQSLSSDERGLIPAGAATGEHLCAGCLKKLPEFVLEHSTMWMLGVHDG